MVHRQRALVEVIYERETNHAGILNGCGLGQWTDMGCV